MQENVVSSSSPATLDSGTTTIISLYEIQRVQSSIWAITLPIMALMFPCCVDKTITTLGRLRFLHHRVNQNQHQRQRQAMFVSPKFYPMRLEAIPHPTRTENGLKFKTWGRKKSMLQDGASLPQVAHSFSINTTCHQNPIPSSKLERPH